MAVLDLPQLVRGLPPPPDPELLPALDAARRCFARHGVTRTSMTDIGRELGVSRSSIYRQLGSIDRTLRLMMARELHELVSVHLASVIASATGPETVVSVLEAVIHHSSKHPVLQKVLTHEPEIIGPYLVTDLPAVTTQIAEMVEPVLQVAMDAGLVRRQDTQHLAAWLLRIVVVCVIDPPPEPIRPLLDQLLLPVLDPAPGG